ncbi:response regulator [Burkholderia cenocepacia]|uniref:ATP-binding protein n=1 Tax=Burkholderia cenocepacia TaxID=95486 RepID=UPI001BACCC27|nr:ATP-binding protein [Burkholderia cenocepacia]QUN38668.1 response regulator [Burkholderia cenocepacia]
MIDLLNRRQREVPPDVTKHLAMRWFGTPLELPLAVSTTELSFTREERAYLKSLPPLKLGYGSGWGPLTYVDSDHRLLGVASDYLDYLERVLGVQFDRQPIDDWLKIQHAFRDGKIDIMIGAKSKDQYSGEFSHSVALDSFPMVIVQPRNAAPITSLDELAGKRVGTMDGLIEGRPANVALPNAQIVPVLSDTLGLEMLNNGELDAYVANLAIADAALTTRYTGELKMSLPIDRQQGMVLTASSRYAPLMPLIDKALLSIPGEERARIRNKWMITRYNYGVSWNTVVRRVLPIGIAFVVALLSIFFAYLRQRREVNRRIVAERALDEQLHLQQALMDTVPYPVLAINERQTLILINRAAEQMFDLNKENALGKQVSELSHTARILEHILAAPSPRRHTLPPNGEIKIAVAQGDARVALYRTADLANHKGRIAAFVDVTDARAAREAEARAVGLLLDVTRALPAVVFQCKMDAGGVLSFPFVGGNAISLFGVSAQAIMEDERNAFLRVLPEDRDALMNEVQRSAETLTVAQPIFRTQVADRMVWISGTAVPRRTEEGETIWTGYWADVTDERLQQAALTEARDVAERASRDKDQFLALMSHEIRTPMHGILGLVELIDEQQLDQHQAHMIAMIRESAKTLMQILNDILDFSKIEAGQLKFEETTINVRNLCDSAAALLEGKVRERGLRFVLDVDAGVALKMVTDGNRIRQILWNLLSNAVKFTPSGQVALRVTSVDARDGKQSIRFSVADTGIGIPLDKQQDIFSPFVQADASTARRYGGTGLGLAICHKLVTMMGGELELRSEEHHGTTVEFTLTTQVANRRTQGLTLTGKRIEIVVGDTETSRTLTNYAIALGLTPCTHEPDITFTDSAGSHTSARRAVIRVCPSDNASTDPTSPAGHSIDTGPIYWNTFIRACEAAHGIAESVNPRPLPAPVHATDHAPAPTESKPLILVAEDHPINKVVIRQQLARLGYACDIVPDGAQLVEAWRSGRYRLILTDCRMPVMDGYEAVRQIRTAERDTGDSIPIVGLTATGSHDEINHSIDVGMNECLMKPVEIDELRECVDEWLGQSNRSADIVRHSSVVTTEAEHPPVLPDSFLASLKGHVFDDIARMEGLLKKDDVKGMDDWLHQVAGWLRFAPASHELQLTFVRVRQDLTRLSAGERAQRIGNILNRLRGMVE